jgi:hypothetical protein
LQESKEENLQNISAKNNTKRNPRQGKKYRYLNQVFFIDSHLVLLSNVGGQRPPMFKNASSMR